MIKLRPFEKADHDFIFSSWLNCYRESKFMKDLPVEEFFKPQRAFMEELFSDRDLDILIACHPDFPDQIFGYAVFEKDPGCTIIHFAYVKQVYRSMGIFRKFMQTANAQIPLYFTHMTKTAPLIAPKYKAIFNPFKLVRRG